MQVDDTGPPTVQMQPFATQAGSAAPSPSKPAAAASSRNRQPALPIFPGDLDPESESDRDEDLEEAAWDGIRRRKRNANDERVRPAYYYPLHEGASRQRGGARGVPVFEPTMAEFADFYDYIQKIDKYGMKSGIVKVVPPKEWTEALPEVTDRLKITRIRTPISELIHGSTGLFRQTNIAKSKQYSAKQWKELSESSQYAMPDFFNTGDPVAVAEKRRGNKRAKVAAAKPEPSQEDQPLSTEQVQPMQPHPNGDAHLAEDDDKSSGASAGLDHPSPAATIIAEDIKPDISATASAKKPRKPTLSSSAKASALDAEWEGFDYKSMMHGLKREHFTVDRCSDVEKKYWRTITFTEPMYGADLEGSLFTAETTSWNVASLNDLLKRIFPHSRIPGVTQPYLYFGMWKATFSWHVEDADLYSINYVHHGAPKFWYSVPQSQYERFERVMTNFFPTDKRNCSQFLRHKSYLASPKKLAEQGLTLNRCVQHAGEFVITYPKGYHSGFNVGYNCAESINFATERWLEYGRLAKACQCVPDSVRLDVEDMLADARREGLINPAVMAAIPRQYRAGRVATEPLFAPLPERSKYEEFESLEAMESRRAEKAAHKAFKAAQTVAKQQKKDEKFKANEAAVAAAAAREASYVCALCPDTDPTSLVKLGAPLTPAQAKDPKRRAGAAHKICVMFTPGTYLAVDPDTGLEYAHGLEDVEKARWGLKCQACNDLHGTKVQCTKSQKCVKAFHVTCALKPDSGAFIDAVVGEGNDAINLIQSAQKDGGSALDVFARMQHLEQPAASGSQTPALPHYISPEKSLVDRAANQSSAAFQSALKSQAPLPQTTDASGYEDPVASIKLVVLCRQHNPDWVKTQAELKLRMLAERVMAMPEGSEMKIKTSSGIFQVRLQCLLADKHSVKVVFEDGKVACHKLTAIVWTDPEVQSAVKRSASAAFDAAPRSTPQPERQQWLPPAAAYAQPNTLLSGLSSSSSIPPYPYLIDNPVWRRQHQLQLLGPPGLMKQTKASLALQPKPVQPQASAAPVFVKQES